VVGVALGWVLITALSGKTLAKARGEAEQITKLAEAEAKAAAGKAEVEAQKRIMGERKRAEQELGKERDEMRESERRLTKREDLHDRKNEALTLKEENLSKRDALIETRDTKSKAHEAELAKVVERSKEELSRVAQISREEAQEQLLQLVEEDVQDDAARLIRAKMEEAKDEAKAKAREITLTAIQRYAGEHVSETTVRAVQIPNDDMKGRIIGREGRNIRAIEKATGVDIIVDDTPGVIVVSCFDKVRQSIAAESMQKLIADGRIHPTRIEEVVEQVRAETDDRIQKFGKEAALEVKIRGMHPKVQEAMGRLHYRTSFGQNILRHSVEVAYVCQIIADQLGLDPLVARRCGYLHDIGKAMDHEVEGTHPQIGMDFAKRYGEKEPVLNAILGHHGDVPSTSFYTPIVMAADAISGARPGARRESMEQYVQRLEQLQDIAMENEGVNEAHAIQAGREVRVMVDAKQVSDDRAYQIAKKIADRVSDEMTFPGEIRVTVLRETRAVEVAR
jgi:ribonuclease Y